MCQVGLEFDVLDAISHLIITITLSLSLLNHYDCGSFDFTKAGHALCKKLK